MEWLCAQCFEYFLLVYFCDPDVVSAALLTPCTVPVVLYHVMSVLYCKSQTNFSM